MTHSGFAYFLQGFSLIKTKGLRRFVFIPLSINLLLFAYAFYFLFGEIIWAIDYLVNLIPDWLAWLQEALVYLLWPFALITVLLLFGLIFGTLANWIAAPFNGLLAEMVERKLTGQGLPDEGLTAIIKDIPRTFAREWTKLAYYLPRAIGFFIILFILPFLGQVIWFLFTAWMLAIQYVDYPFDNHKINFTQTRQALTQHTSKTYSFGIAVNVFSMLPIINFLVMPVAICGATAMWVDLYRADALMLAATTKDKLAQSA